MKKGLHLFIFDTDSEKVRGPFSIDLLKGLVEVGKVTPETLISIGKDHEWRAISEEESLMGLLFPDTPGLHLAAPTAAQAEPNPGADINVFKILEENRAVEDDDKLIITEEDMIRARFFNFSQRTRDYFVLLAVTTILTLFAGYFFGANSNPLVLTFALSGWTIASLGLAYVFFFVMDSY